MYEEEASERFHGQPRSLARGAPATQHALEVPTTRSSAAGSALVVLTTEKVEQRLRFDYWVGAISEVMFALSSTSPEAATFRSEMRGAPLDELFLMKIEGSARNSYRTQKTLARASDYAFHLMGDFRYPSTIDWRGTKVWLAPRDLIFTDTRYVHSGSYSEGLLGVNIKIPAAWARSWLRDPERLAGKRIRGDAGWGAALSNFLEQLTPDLILDAPLPPKVLGDNIGALLSLVESEVLGQPLISQVKERELCELVKETIRQRAAEPGLTALDVANTLNVSERTLHRCLAAAGERFAPLLLQCRVELARRMLEAGNLGRLTTAEIGRRSGFSDPSYFVRATTRVLGLTPGRYRQAVRS